MFINDLHDCNLFQITYINNSEIELLISDNLTIPHKEYKINITGISYLKIYNFQRENIILDIEIFEADNIDDNDLKLTVGYTNENFQKIREKIKQNKFIRLLGSYGCDIYCICCNITSTYID